MQKTQEGYQVLPSIDKARYDEIQGMEGPFMTRSGKVVYYDPQEGAYYDRDTDMYLTYDEWRSLDEGYEGDLHPSIDMTRDDDELNFCYDCKLISYTLGEIDTDNDETDVVCPRCGSLAYFVASDEEIAKYGKVSEMKCIAVGEDSKVPNYSKMIQNISPKGAEKMKLPEPGMSSDEPPMSPNEVERQKRIGDGGGYSPPTKKPTSKKSTYMKPIISFPRDIPSFGTILTNAMERMKEATGDVELLKPMVDMDPKVLPIYAKNIIKKYPHLKPSVDAMIGKQESVATEGKNKMGPQGIMPGDRVEHEGEMYEVVAVDGDILTVDNLQNGNRTKFKMDDVTPLFGMDAMTDQDKDNLDAMFKRLDKVGSGSLKHVATEDATKRAGDAELLKPMINMDPKVLPIYAKNIIKKYPHMQRSVNAMLPRESVAEGMMDDEVKAILMKYPKELEKLKASEDLMDVYDTPLYQELFSYYADSGEMPYDTMKARDGDPVQFIQDELDDMGVFEGFASDAQRKAAFASGYDPKKKKKNETVDISKLKASINMTEATDSQAVAGYVRTLLNSSHNTWKKVDEEIDFVINKLSEGHQAYAEEARTELHKRWMQEYFDNGIKVSENVDTMRKIVKNKSAMPVKFSDGTMKVDMTSANIFLQAYDKMKERNQEKINQMMQTKAGFLRVMDFIYGAMK